MRFLLTIGGAGAQKDIFAAIIRTALASVKTGNMVLYVNVGDYMNVWEELVREIPAMESHVTTHFDDWSYTTAFADKALKEEVYGIHAFCHENIYEAVYCTNLLMRSCDVLITKPSELSFYQVPKLFMQDDSILTDMCENIKRNKLDGIYDGAYEVVKLAMDMKN